VPTRPLTNTRKPLAQFIFPPPLLLKRSRLRYYRYPPARGSPGDTGSTPADPGSSNNNRIAALPADYRPEALARAPPLELDSSMDRMGRTGSTGSSSLGIGSTGSTDHMESMGNMGSVDSAGSTGSSMDTGGMGSTDSIDSMESMESTGTTSTSATTVPRRLSLRKRSENALRGDISSRQKKEVLPRG
jgi:hypothetical protein